MKVTYYASSTVLVDTGRLKILMDPWLEDGEYYGSWSHLPSLKFDYSTFDDVDFVYISHIHPDHLSKKTLSNISRRVPILIHNYEEKFLKRNIESLGFEVRELPHNTKTELDGVTSITILAADDCNPELCGAYFGCAPLVTKLGSSQIDTLCVVEDSNHVIVNTNDCPFGLVQGVLKRITKQFPTIDLLLTGYSGAGPYPQCFANLAAVEKTTAAEAKKNQFLNYGLSYIQALRPRYVLPFAGQYTLSGSLAHLNALRGVSTLSEAKIFFEERLQGDGPRIVLLARGGCLDLSDGFVSGSYSAPSILDEEAYVREVLSKRVFDFEGDDQPKEDDLIRMSFQAAARVERKRQGLNVSSPTDVYVRLVNQLFIKISLLGRDPALVKEIDKSRPYVALGVAPKLLSRILTGPREAHWNNATIGSHVEFDRAPNVYEPPVFEVMNYFHS